MRAAIISGAGGPEVVRVEEVPDPEPGRGEVLVEISTAALNRRDVWIRTGERAQPGDVLGSDAARTARRRTARSWAFRTRVPTPS